MKMEKNKLLNDIVIASGKHPSRIFNIIIFGSQIYGTSNPNSDIDIIMIANNSYESSEIRSGKFNIHIYTPDKFRQDLDWHRINNLECIFAPDWAKLKEDIKFDDFKLNLPRLRHAISHISSNSWVKTKKKLAYNTSDEYYTGIKSLFHSIRIPMFGTQIAKYGRITDFSCANWVWDKLKSSKWTWHELDNEFREVHNNVLTEFRKFAIK